MVNVNGELGANKDKWMIEKIRSCPCTITIPPSKTCTTGTKLQSLRISVIENDTAARVFREGAVHDDMSQVVAKGTETVWTIVGGVAEVAAKRTVVSSATVLRMAQGSLATVGAFIFQAIDTKMPCDMAVKTMSLTSRCGFWAQMVVSRCNSSGVGSSLALMESRMRISRDIQQRGGG